MDPSTYNHLLQRRKEMALARQQEDLERAAQYQKEDSIFENNRETSLLSLDQQFQARRQTQISESLHAVKSLKSKHEQEFAALEERHKAEAIALKEGIERKERDLEDNFNKQYVALRISLAQADGDRVENRKRAEIKLQGMRFTEDMALRNEVFTTFEKEALAGSSSSREHSSSSPEPSPVTPEDRFEEEREEDLGQYQETYSLEGEIFIGFKGEGSVGQAIAPEQPPFQLEHCDVHKPLEDSMDVHMEHGGQEDLDTQTIQSGLARLPVKPQFPSVQQTSKRQKIGGTPISRAPEELSTNTKALPKPVEPKLAFKLKSFKCGSATWHHSPNLLLKVIRENQTFEIFHGNHSLSSMHPDWVLDGKAGQSSFYNASQNTFELHRDGRITIKLEFKFAGELTDFLAQYKEYYGEFISITKC